MPVTSEPIPWAAMKLMNVSDGFTASREAAGAAAVSTPSLRPFLRLRRFLPDTLSPSSATAAATTESSARSPPRPRRFFFRPSRSRPSRPRRPSRGSGVAATSAMISSIGFAAERRTRTGGGAFGTGMGLSASGDPMRTCPRLESRTASRLRGPRTGTRAVNTQPRPGIGFPPTRRSLANSQSYVPWNSWNESFEKMVAPSLSATFRMKASPRPTVPAGGVMISPAM